MISSGLVRKIPILRQVSSQFDDRNGVFVYGPLVPGYGITIGIALRRVLLSSIPGCGIIAAKIDGVSHEYSSISGMREDVLTFIQHLKLVTFKINSKFSENLCVTLEVKGPCEVTSDDIVCPSAVSITNKKYLCYLNEGAHLKCDLFLEYREGYVEVKANRLYSKPGTIGIDNVLNSVRTVSINIKENIQHLGDAAYEELELSIKTDGSINPEEAIGRAVDILISQLAEISTESTVPNKIAGHDLDMSSANRSLEECNLPSGTVSALKEKGITTVLELSNCTRKDLFEVPRVGLRKIGELERILAQSGLKLKSGDDNSQKRRKNQEEEI